MSTRLARFALFALSPFLALSPLRSQTTRDQSVMLSPKFNGSTGQQNYVTWTPPATAETATGILRTIETPNSPSTIFLDPPQTTWQFDVPHSTSSWMEVQQIWRINDVRMLATGYVQAGTTRTGRMLETRRKVLIIADQGASTTLSLELARLSDDLRREGWTVAIATTSQNTTPRSIKTEIILPAWRDTTTGKLTHVILIGDIPYAMSGGFSTKGGIPNPDYHPEHGGAWASDAYYADAETSPGVDAEYQWTDQFVDLPGPAEPDRIQNRNVPGDGKFDQSLIPTDLELCVGRVDMRDLPVFGTSTTDRAREYELLRRYLDRNHQYRTRAFEPPQRALIDDNFGLFARVDDDMRIIEAFASSGYRSFAPIVGADSIFEGDWIFNAQSPRRSLDSTPSLFAYGCGGGGYEHCSGVAEVADFTKNPLNAVFTLLFGSYFADVNSTNNIMRAALAADGWVLTCGWSGRPHWFLHPLADGATIGECQRLSANNAGTYVGGTVEDLVTGLFAPFSIGERNIHILLLGDPTLTLQGPVIGGDLIVQELAETGETYLSWRTFPQASYLIEAGPSIDRPLTVVDTVMAGTRLMAETKVVLPSNAAVVRVRPYFTSEGRLAPLAGRGVIGSRTVSSVVQRPTSDEERPASDVRRPTRVLDVMGRTVLEITGTEAEVKTTVLETDLPVGLYLISRGSLGFPVLKSR